MTSLAKSPRSDVALVRTAAGLQPNEGPSDEAIESAIDGFAGQFEFWFTRVIAGSVPKYRNVIISRINGFIRPIEFDGLSATEVATRLVSDYVNRNFVTAGGWAIEKMAIALGTGGSKAAARGIDLHRIDAKGDHHLYVVKSGKVTRNSDILDKLKQHAREAEKLLKQGGAKIGVFANYVVAAGAITSTFEDGIYRPASGQFWSEITELPEPQALRLALEIARAGGLKVARNTDVHIGALCTLVNAYICSKEKPDAVDWPFLFIRTMTERKHWNDEDAARHAAAMKELKVTGYEIAKEPTRTSKKAAAQPTRKPSKLQAKGKAARGQRKAQEV